MHMKRINAKKAHIEKAVHTHFQPEHIVMESARNDKYMLNTCDLLERWSEWVPTEEKAIVLLHLCCFAEQKPNERIRKGSVGYYEI